MRTNAALTSIQAVSPELTLAVSASMLMGAHIEKGKTNILMDLRSVSYISSTGIGSIIKAYRSVMRKDGHVKLLNPSQCVRNILSISKLDGMFEIFTDEKEAVASFSS